MRPLHVDYIKYALQDKKSDEYDLYHAKQALAVRNYRGFESLFTNGYIDLEKHGAELLTAFLKGSRPTGAPMEGPYYDEHGQGLASLLIVCGAKREDIAKCLDYGELAKEVMNPSFTALKCYDQQFAQLAEARYNAIMNRSKTQGHHEFVKAENARSEQVTENTEGLYADDVKPGLRLNSPLKIGNRVIEPSTEIVKS